MSVWLPCEGGRLSRPSPASADGTHVESALPSSSVTADAVLQEQRSPLLSSSNARGLAVPRPAVGVGRGGKMVGQTLAPQNDPESWLLAKIGKEHFSGRETTFQKVFLALLPPNCPPAPSFSFTGEEGSRWGVSIWAVGIRLQSPWLPSTPPHRTAFLPIFLVWGTANFLAVWSPKPSPPQRF